MTGSFVPLYHQQLGDDDKPCFVILHGLFGSSPNFTTLAKALSDEFRVIRFDLPNHGRSYHTENHHYALMAEAVLTSLSDLGVDEFILLGHSMGGKAAMEIAELAPERVSRLIVVDIAPVVYSQSAHNDVISAMSAVDLPNLSSRKQAEETLAQWISEPMLRQFILTNLKRDGERFDWRVNLAVIKRDYAFIAKAPNLSKVFSAPTLFVRGGASDYILQEHEGVIHQYYSDVSIVTIEGAGHWLHAETPQEFWAALSGFLSKG